MMPSTLAGMLLAMQAPVAVEVPAVQAFEPIASLQRSKPLLMPGSGAMPGFMAPRAIEGERRKSVDPRSPFYHPQFSR